MEVAEVGPSVKGAIFQMAVEAVKQAIEEGRISEEEVAVKLEAEDLRFLDEKILTGTWYPVDSFDRMVQLTSRSISAEYPDYLVRRGRRAADQLLGNQIYRRFNDTIHERGDQGGASVLTLAQLMMNFSRWDLLPYETGDPAHFVIEVNEAGPMPDVLRYTAQGFIERVAELMVGSPMKVTSKRPTLDQLIFTGHPAEA
jgi:hypothetical protein